MQQSYIIQLFIVHNHNLRNFRQKHNESSYVHVKLQPSAPLLFHGPHSSASTVKLRLTLSENVL